MRVQLVLAIDRLAEVSVRIRGLVVAARADLGRSDPDEFWHPAGIHTGLQPHGDTAPAGRDEGWIDVQGPHDVDGERLRRVGNHRLARACITTTINW